jgi:hypothetical protein
MEKAHRIPSAQLTIMERIASILGESVSEFFGVNTSEKLAETIALVKAFTALVDPAARARCLDFAARELEQQDQLVHGASPTSQQSATTRTPISRNFKHVSG